LFEDDGKRRSTLNAKTARPGWTLLFLLACLDPCFSWKVAVGSSTTAYERLLGAVFRLLGGKSRGQSARGEVNVSLELLHKFLLGASESPVYSFYGLEHGCLRIHG
jgi:hypothetical protein